MTPLELSGVARKLIDPVKQDIVKFTLTPGSDRTTCHSRYVFTDDLTFSVTSGREVPSKRSIFVGGNPLWSAILSDGLDFLDLEIKIAPGERPQCDANYLHTKMSLPSEDVGGIVVDITLPQRGFSLVEIDDLFRRVRGCVVHECKHVVQRIFEGAKFTTRCETLTKHVRSKYEIDARTAEVISLCRSIDPTVEEFSAEMEKYVSDYFDRNDVSLAERETLGPEMVRSHVNFFKRRYT